MFKHGFRICLHTLWGTYLLLFKPTCRGSKHSNIASRKTEVFLAGILKPWHSFSSGSDLGNLPVSVKKVLGRRRHVGRSACKAPNQGLESSFCCRTALMLMAGSLLVLLCARVTSLDGASCRASVRAASAQLGNQTVMFIIYRYTSLILVGPNSKLGFPVPSLAPNSTFRTKCCKELLPRRPSRSGGGSSASRRST